MRQTRRCGAGLSLCALIAITSLGCGGRSPTPYDCAIERPNLDVLLEQAAEACRALTPEDRAAVGCDEPEQGPLLPATYEWLKRVDRDIGVFGEPD